MLRFASSELLLVNDYARVPGGAELQRRLDRVLDRRLGSVTRVTLPYRGSDSQLDGCPGARGNYANLLCTSQRVYVPVYDVPEDREAEAVFEYLFPGRVSYVPSAPIARYGGSLHCITWNYV
jgi:agmatine/peptidylarginine deiminase